MSAVAAIVALIDCLALGVLLLVPLAGPLGLTDVEVPVSAFLGWFMLAIPLAMSLAALVAAPLRIAKAQQAVYIQTTFCLCGLTLLLCATMLIDARFGLINAPPADADLASMSSIAATAAALYAMNVLALWQPFAAALRE